MDETKEPHENGAGNLLEIVDMMCDVVERMTGIVRKQRVTVSGRTWYKTTDGFWISGAPEHTEFVEGNM